jgi:hypothetical protein
MSSEYFVWTTKRAHTKAQGLAANEAIKKIDPEAGFVSYCQPGNETRGWIYRPNDGRNDENSIRERNKRLITAAKIAIGIATPAYPSGRWASRKEGGA